MFYFQDIYLFFLAYLLGSIPFGLLLTKYVQGIDIRGIGSGNIGATNVLRTGNKKIAVATLFLDALKGAIAVYLASLFGEAEGVALVSAIFAVLGHIFPLWLWFKGGKGVATALGVMIPLNPYVFLFTVICWLVVAKIFRISSLSALVSFILTPIAAYLLDEPSLAILSLLIALLLVWTHRSNLKRLLSGEEGRF